MEAHKNKMNLLVIEINRLEEENQKLNSKLKRMISNYDDLQKQIRYHENQHLTRVNRSQIFSPGHQIEDNFNFRVLSPRSVNIGSSGIVSHQSSDSHKRAAQEKNEKDTRFMDDQQLTSKKRKINQLQLDQFQNGMINSSLDESPNKKPQVLSNGSGKQTATAPKRIVSVRTRSEASVVSDGCRWRKYGQKSTRNNPYVRSYYRCAMATSCPVKKQVQKYAEDPTTVITTYEGEHIHPLSSFAIDTMHAASSEQVIAGEGMNIGNFVADNQFIPCNATISTSTPFPTIILDLTGNRPNSGLQLQPPHLAAGNFPPASNDFSQLLDHNTTGQSSIMDSAAVSTTADPNFSAALAVAIAGSMLNLCAAVQGMPDFRHGTQCSDGSNHEAFV